MAINTIQYAQLLQKKLDEQIVVQSTSGWMEANAGLVQYDGGREIKVPSLSTTGLTDYDRDNGFTRGAVTLSHETLTMTMDRGATFQLDAMDVNKSGFLASATTVAGEFQRTRGAFSIPHRSCAILVEMTRDTNRTRPDIPHNKAILLTARFVFCCFSAPEFLNLPCF